ncbi:hypothetical protein VITU102760_14995 [Vibrio tubiashii]|uniref:Uncharacterized protein n=1 Tax=Vibrio tubiashii ATCC 19109 TaxID=1051646 RepID=F9T4F2_9VIBR|nr:hypothetical protein [Vibrio tubiashii]AIW13322.1 hypothetical protein IX91_03760 [Vibrio tubiashii ATCC 19109]EGU56063.1 hypothetical protein VITU9109_08882 [Vibrio tubiashii ATCC 19109]EIF04458.1 hypothetical protein VT1337_08306 [Vibrio tubiashii NCIMB 1337 = ATCC 19106]
MNIKQLDYLPEIVSREGAMSFLIGLLSTQGVKASKAWDLPTQLQRRVEERGGDLRGMSLSEVVALMQATPALHRYPKKISRYVVELIAHIETEYGGDPRCIWSGVPTVQALQVALKKISGLGAHKAELAVFFLCFHYGIDVDSSRAKNIHLSALCPRLFESIGRPDEYFYWE